MLQKHLQKRKLSYRHCVPSSIDRSSSPMGSKNSSATLMGLSPYNLCCPLKVNVLSIALQNLYRKGSAVSLPIIDKDLCEVTSSTARHNDLMHHLSQLDSWSSKKYHQKKRKLLPPCIFAEPPQTQQNFNFKPRPCLHLAPLRRCRPSFLQLLAQRI